MTFEILAALVATSLGLQQPTPARTGPAAPDNDPIVVRGCLEGRHLRILEHDLSDLSGIRDIRLKGPRGVMRVIDEHEHLYVEVTGTLDLGKRDRLDTRKKVKAGGKTTMSIGAATEQITGSPVVADPVFVVAAVTPLGERCPGR
jgi:hypothetical protein